MKVLRCWSVVAGIGPALLLPVAPAAAAAAAVSAVAAPFDHQDEEEGERGLQDCVPDECAALASVRLNLCRKSEFIHDATNNGFYGCWYSILNPLSPENDPRNVCKVDEPTVLFLSNLEACAEKIQSIHFEVFNGNKVRSYTQREFPYTVFGDTTSPFSVNTRALPVGSWHTIAVTIKDTNGCVSLEQFYSFEMIECLA